MLFCISMVSENYAASIYIQHWCICLIFLGHLLQKSFFLNFFIFNLISKVSDLISFLHLVKRLCKGKVTRFSLIELSSEQLITCRTDSFAQYIRACLWVVSYRKRLLLGNGMDWIAGLAFKLYVVDCVLIIAYWYTTLFTSNWGMHCYLYNYSESPLNYKKLFRVSVPRYCFISN